MSDPPIPGGGGIRPQPPGVAHAPGVGVHLAAERPAIVPSLSPAIPLGMGRDSDGPKALRTRARSIRRRPVTGPFFAALVTVDIWSVRA